MSTINVAVVGAGLVGKEFLQQLGAVNVKSNGNPTFKLIYVSSSSKYAESTTGIPFDAVSEVLSNATSKPGRSLSEAIGQIAKEGRTIVVDNTSSEDIAAQYPELLSKGFYIVTPNKKAFSSDLSLYKDILAASSGSGGGKYLNESTVGAGLPILSTLKDLVLTGDKIIKIEGVFSGTLSYIFNEFSTPSGKGPSFSSIVATAREKGYTEPHPGDDLNGADVARKLTILSRLIPELQSQLPEGYKSVSITSLVPDALASITSGDEFVNRLPEFDAEFEKLREEARKEGKVLRYAGVIDVGQNIVKASLEKYPATHAFATSLQGSDNIIAFHTERYGARPLIVQGAGAGAAVTAMGVLGDLLKFV